MRLALVLNGGVSLAVWIGGVTHELDRLRRAFEMEMGSAYAHLLRSLGCVVRIDVIGGASAGGLNGAMLASAIAYGRSLETAAAAGTPEATATDPWMRGRWLDLGDLASLIRKPVNPGQPDPSSVLDGDGGMLAPLRDEVFTKLVPDEGPDPTSTTRQPIAYVATTTDVVGEPFTRFDDYGGEFRDREHRALLQFTADPDNPWAPTSDDDFAIHPVPGERMPDRRQKVRDQLARAARSTSSFPLAFEPSHWQEATDVASFPSSRYLADGGIFDNAPFGRVIDAIRDRRAVRLTHRVLAYICAYDDPLEAPPDEYSTLPSISAMLDLTLNKPRDVSMTSGLARLDEMRRGQDERPRPRDELVIAIQAGPALTELATGVFAGYQLSRLEAMLDGIVEHAQEQLGTVDPALRRDIDSDDAFLAAIDAVVLPARFSVDGEWTWGVTAAKRGIQMLTDGLLYALRLTPREAASAGARNELRTARDLLSRLWQQVDRLGHEIEAAEARAFPTAVGATPPDWIENVFAARRAVMVAWPTAAAELALGPVPDERRGLADILTQAIATARAQLANLQAVVTDDNQLTDRYRVRYVNAIAALLSSPAGDATVLEAVATLEVLSVALGVTTATDAPSFEVKRMTARAYGPDGVRREPDEKLTGLQLGHFGAFLKRSWRANDWMWGRVDAVDHITQLLLAPARVSRVRHPRQLAETLVHLAGISGDAELEAGIAGLVETSARASATPSERQAAAQGIEEFRITHLVPALQRQIISEEVPAIQRARADDRVRDGHAPLAPARPGAAAAVPEADAPAGAMPPSAEEIDVAVAALSASEPESAAAELRRTLARETAGSNFPSRSITRPTGNAIATGLQAFTSPDNRLPSAARAPLRFLTPFPFLFYGLSQGPSRKHLRSVFLQGALWISLALTLGAILVAPIWLLAGWVLDSDSMLLTTLLALVAIALYTLAVAVLIALALTGMTVRLLAGKRPSRRPPLPARVCRLVRRGGGMARGARLALVPRKVDDVRCECPGRVGGGFGRGQLGGTLWAHAGVEP